MQDQVGTVSDPPGRSVVYGLNALSIWLFGTMRQTEGKVFQSPIFVTMGRIALCFVIAYRAGRRHEALVLPALPRSAGLDHAQNAKTLGAMPATVDAAERQIAHLPCRFRWMSTPELWLSRSAAFQAAQMNRRLRGRAPEPKGKLPEFQRFQENYAATQKNT